MDWNFLKVRLRKLQFLDRRSLWGLLESWQMLFHGEAEKEREGEGEEEKELRLVNFRDQW